MVYEKKLKMEELLKFIRAFDNIKIEHIILKHLIEKGCDSTDKIRVLLSQDIYLSSVTKNHLENVMRDYERGFMKLNKIPSVEYKNN